MNRKRSLGLGILTALHIALFVGSLGCSSFQEHKEQRILEKVREFDQLIVVHPTFYFDKKSEAKGAINQITEYFLKAQVPVSTLVETNTIINDIKSQRDLGQPNPDLSLAANYSSYLEKIRQTRLVVSENGENQLKAKGRNVVVVGGYLAACLRTAVRDFAKLNRSTTEPLRIFMPLDAIYGKQLARDLGPKNEKEMKKNIESFLAKDTNLKIFVNQKLKVSIYNSGKYKIEIYLRRPKKTVGETLNAY